MNVSRILSTCLVFCCVSHALDEEALQFESSKLLMVINTKPAIEKLHALRAAIDEEDARHSVDIPKQILFLEDVHDLYQPLSDNSEREFIEAENYIGDKITGFCRNSSVYGKTIEGMCRDYDEKCRNADEECLPSDMATYIARYFYKQGDVGLAEKFYRLSVRSTRVFENFVYLEIADAFVDYINKIIQNTRPHKPTAEIFNALIKAISYNKLDNEDDGTGSFGDVKNSVLIKHRDLIVRWPWSPTKVSNDRYYEAGAILSIIYSHDFVSNLLNDIFTIKEIWNLNSFNGSSNDANIFFYLSERGFVCRRGTFGGYPQYILVNEKGYVVRVKYKKETNKWQFTVGLLLKNPYEWGNRDAVRLLKGSHESNEHSQYGKDLAGYDFVDECQSNEVLKIKFDKGMVQIVPASFYYRVVGQDIRNCDYWANHNESKSFMDSAHREIKPVGRCKKPGQHPDTSAIDAWCINVDKKTGDVN